MESHDSRHLVSESSTQLVRGHETKSTAVPMKKHRKYSATTGIAAAILVMNCVQPVNAAVVNLTNETIAGNPQSTVVGSTVTFVGGYLNNGLFRRPLDADESNSGSGIFRDLYKVDNNGGPEAGYNRPGVMDAEVPNGFQPGNMITIGDLVEDSTGTAYVFVMDVNETGNATGRFMSLDDVRIYVGGVTDPPVLPQSLSEMFASFGAPVWEMNPAGQSNHVLMDYSLYSGSGTLDTFLFVPKGYFDGLAADQQVYLYTQFGAYTGAPGFGPEAGPEQVSIPGKAVSGTVDPLVSIVPEPGAAGLLLTAGLLRLLRRRR